jgi:hypothetical protein
VRFTLKEFMAKPPFELLSNKIIKNLFLNVNRQTESPHPTLSSGVERGEGREEMKEIPARWREKILG